MSMSPARARVQQLLIYFGLAEDPERAAARRAAAPGERVVAKRDLWLIAILPVLLTSYVWSDRGALVGGALLVIFLPAVVVGTGLGPLAAVRQRNPDLEDLLVVPGVMLGAALLLVPNAYAIWIPIAIGAAASALVIALGRRPSKAG